MTHDDEKSTERITNLESLLDNFQRDKEISESNDKEYSQKNKEKSTALRKKCEFIRDKIKTRYEPKEQRIKRKAMSGIK